MRRSRIVFLIAAAVGARRVSAQNAGDLPGPPIARAARVGSPPVIDGRLGDSAWASAPPIGQFVQHEPFDGRPATERTEVRVIYDRDAIYVAARLYDVDPAGIIRGETRRDLSLKEQDAFLILLDTYHDRQNGYVFGTTPAGIQHDGQVTKEGEGGFGGPASSQPTITGANENVNWDGAWSVATTVDSLGWVAEFRIPFQTLRYGAGVDQTWGLNLARYIRRKNEEDFWAPVPRQHTFFRVSLAGTLEGLDPPSRRPAQLIPYLLASVRRDYASGEPTDGQGEAGFDAKFGLTPSLTLDLTYNTDFAQVEADEQQINLTRFNLFFPEKRPFFLENAGTFAFGTPQSVDLFFSRRVGIGEGGQPVPILAGGRVSGRIGGLSVGLLGVQTDAVDVAGERVEDGTNYAVGRLVYELPHRSRIGAVVVNRLNTDSTADHSVVVGVDGRVGIGDAVSVDGYVAHSATPDVSQSSFAYNLSGTYTTRLWEIGAAVRQVDEGFRADVGFLERPSFRFTSLRILRHLRTPKIPWFRETRPHITFRQYDDVDGTPQSRLIHVDSHFLFANGAFFELPGTNFTREALRDTFEIAPGVRIPPGVYDHFEWATVFNTNLSSPYSLSGTATIGGFYTGHRWGGSLTFALRPNDAINAALALTYDNVDLSEGAFERVLTRFKLAYAFTPALYLQALTQYDNQSESLGANVRFGWLGPAGTGLFVVYNEGRTTGTSPGVANRALAIKFTRQIDLW